jgi:hypothetical protein
MRSLLLSFISLALLGLAAPLATVQAAQPGCVAAPAGLAEWLSFDKETAPGRVGHGLLLDGKTQFREVPGWHVGSGDFSVEAWFRTSDATVIRNFLDNRDADARGFLLFVRRGEAGFQLSDGGQPVDVIGTAYPIADGKWHHVVGVVKRLPPQPALIYVDGQLRGKSNSYAPRADLDHNDPLWLGRHHYNRFVTRNDRFFAGSIDEAALYHAALSAAEIERLYHAGAAGKCLSSKR